MGTGSPVRWRSSAPASTSRFSPLRRIRVARWSSRKSAANRSESCSPSSRSSISRSWRSTSPWVRRERLTNISLTFARSAACSDASRTASLCTASNARATWPTSSREYTGTGSIRTFLVSTSRRAELFDDGGQGAGRPRQMPMRARRGAA